MNSRGPFQPQLLCGSVPILVIYEAEVRLRIPTELCMTGSRQLFASEVTGSWVLLCSLLSLGNKELPSALKPMMIALNCWPASQVNENRTSPTPSSFLQGGPFCSRPRFRPKLALAPCAPPTTMKVPSNILQQTVHPKYWAEITHKPYKAFSRCFYNGKKRYIKPKNRVQENA